MKYSFINWRKHKGNSIRSLRHNFANSQIILGYQGILTKWQKYTKIYFAGLMNHFAKDLLFWDPDNLTKAPVSLSKKYNLAFYLGCSVGRILQKNDWAFDVNFQYVMPQAVPDYDMAGIGKGNAAEVGLYSSDVHGRFGRISRNNAVGEANYKGIVFSFLYAITGNLTLYQSFEVSTNQTKSFGPVIDFKRYEMEFIYAF